MGGNMEVLLQVLGGGFYLLNKILWWLAEKLRRQGNQAKADQKELQSWVMYLLGLPPWVIFFVFQHNWIAASVEAAGAPGMVLGIVSVLHGRKRKKPPQWLNMISLCFIPLGFTVSLIDFGGIAKLSQWLEIGLVTGYLAGTYFKTKKWPSAYLWLILMHICCGWLMWIQNYPWLFAQQIVSLIFIVDAYRIARTAN